MLVPASQVVLRIKLANLCSKLSSSKKKEERTLLVEDLSWVGVVSKSLLCGLKGILMGSQQAAWYPVGRIPRRVSQDVSQFQSPYEDLWNYGSPYGRCREQNPSRTITWAKPGTVSSWELKKKKPPVRCVSWEIHRKSCRVDTAQLQGPGIS